MIEKREEVYKIIVESKYGSKTTLFVKNWMERWIPLAHDLYHITDICHSQGKVDKEKLYKLKTHIASFVNNWFEFVYYKNPIFWKLHMLMCGLISYAEKYHMIGRLDEQGMESKHFEMRRHKETMGRISQRLVRVQMLSERQQTCLVQGVLNSLDYLEGFDEEAKTGKRGTYKKQKERTRLAENMEIYKKDRNTGEYDEYFTSEEDNLIDKRWKVLYIFVKFGKVPDDWT